MPPTPTDYDFYRNELDYLYNLHSDAMVQSGTAIFLSVAGLLLVSYVLWYGIFGGLMKFLITFGLRCLVVSTLLTWWNHPVTWLGWNYSFHEVFPNTAEYYTNIIGLKQTDVVYAAIGRMISGMPHQVWKDGIQVITSAGVQVIMWIYEAVIYGLMFISFGMLAVTNFIAPILFWTFLVPQLSSVFWGVIFSMWQYAYQRVAAASVVFILTAVMIDFIQNVVKGDYSIEHFTVIFGKLIPMVFSTAWLAFRTGPMVADWFKGTTSAGSNMLTSVLAIKGVTRRGR